VTVAEIDFDRQDAERLITLAWTYNTTNQPFVPTRGTIVRVAPLRSMRDRSGYSYFRIIPGTNLPEAYTQHIGGYGADVLVSRYWELSELHSVSAGVLAGWANVDDRVDPGTFRTPNVAWRPAYQVVRAGYSRNLWHGDPKSGDSRIEFDGRFVLQQRNVQRGREVFGTLPDHVNTFQAATSWVRRSSWGMLRLGVGYSWGH